MKKRKSRGITQLGSRKYRIRIKVINPRTGKPREVDRIVDDINLAEARRLREEWRAAIRAGEVEEMEARVTLEDFATLWLSAKLRRIKPSTAERYASALDLHIVPALGGLFMDSLSGDDIERWVESEVRQGYEPETVNGWLRVLKTICKAAAAKLDIANPALSIEPLSARHIEDGRERVGLTPSELRRLLHVVGEAAPEQFALLLTLSLTGMRWGEATALRWEDIDEESEVIRVRRSHVRKSVSSPKTRSSVRTYHLPPVLIDALRDHRRRLIAEQHPGLELGLVFATRSREDRSKAVMRYPSSWQKSLPKWLEAAGVDKHVTPHSFRRTAVDALRRAKVDAIVARSFVGHATEAMTYNYSTVDDEERREAMDKVVELYGVGGAK